MQVERKSIDVSDQKSEVSLKSTHWDAWPAEMTLRIMG
jgi:hypothetical protein